jgi:RNA polymerase sigma factor (sigma-70 family)
MSKLSAGDRFLLDQIRGGDTAGWAQIVSRYQGRLLAYARARFVNHADAEDVVQETFLSFLRSLGSFREQASLETYLFGILRRRIVDRVRSRGRQHDVAFCTLQGAQSSTDDQSNANGLDPVDSVPTASWYVAKSEQSAQQYAMLDHAVSELINKLRQGLNFRDLMISEMVFYAQLRNKEIAELMNIDQKQVALIKHRFIKRLQADMTGAENLALLNADGDAPRDNLLTRVWEAARPSCPKRSTIGKYLLGTLDEDWQEYVRFHVETLGCRFCQANRDDLAAEREADENDVFRQRVFQSTVGFFQRPS